MAGSAPIDQILATQWPTAIGVCAGGMASDVNSISASGSCSANSSMVLRSKLRVSYHQSSCTRSSARYARSSSGVAQAGLACRGRRRRCPTAVVPRASAQSEPRRERAVHGGQRLRRGGKARAMCTPAEPIRRALRRQRRRHPRRSFARSSGRRPQAGSPRRRRRDTTARRPARLSACCSEGPRTSLGRLAEAPRAVSWSTIRIRLLANSALNMGLTVLPCPKNGRPLPKL